MKISSFSPRIKEVLNSWLVDWAARMDILTFVCSDETEVTCLSYCSCTEFFDKRKF